MPLSTHQRELLSGYVDGELSAAEAAEVAHWLAEVPAAGEYLRELERLRETLVNQPRRTLPDDFAERLVAQLPAAPWEQHSAPDGPSSNRVLGVGDALGEAPSTRERSGNRGVRTGGPPPAPRRRAWALALGLLAVAASLLLAVMLSFRGPSNPDRLPLAGDPAKAQPDNTPSDSTPPGSIPQPRGRATDPPPAQYVGDGKRLDPDADSGDQFQLLVVMEVVLTGKGAQEGTFPKILRRAGIDQFPVLEADAALEKLLLDRRAYGALARPDAEPDAETAPRPQRVDLYYVAAEGDQFDAIHEEVKLERTRETIAGAQFDLAFAPRQVEIFKLLEQRAALQLASGEPRRRTLAGSVRRIALSAAGHNRLTRVLGLLTPAAFSLIRSEPATGAATDSPPPLDTPPGRGDLEGLGKPQILFVVRYQQ